MKQPSAENDRQPGQSLPSAVIETDGNRQLVHLPENFRIDVSEVYLKRLGRSVLLIPKDANPWEVLEQSLELVTEDFLSDRRQSPEQMREASFD